MDFDLTDEQKLLAETVGRYAERSYDFAARKIGLESESGWRQDAWRDIAALGLTAIAIPADHGGLGAGPVETMLVMQAFGRCLLLEPYLASAVTATTLIARLGTEAQKAALFPGLAEGQRIGAFAHEERGMRGDFARVITRAQKNGSGYVLDGAKSVVVHGGAADFLLVSARVSGQGEDPHGLAVFLVDPQAPGVTRRVYRTLDGLSGADFSFEGVAVNADAVLGHSHEAWPAIAYTIDATLAALSAEAFGAMQELNRLTAEYLRTRKQFGQPLAAFQALRHRYSEMLIHAEQAQSMSILATLALLDADPAERSRKVAAAKAFIGKAARHIAQEAVQMHGGMGMTQEMSASHYFKRLTAIDLTYGSSDLHRERFIAGNPSYRA